MIYDFKVMKRNGEELSLKDYEGKVILIVNTATGCGFTPQYEPIEEMYKKYHEQGLEILDIPCNQFGNQAPGSDEEIHEFCTLHYNTTFEQMKKADVNGDNELPLYAYLKSQKGFEGFGKGPSAMFMENHLKKIDPNYSSNPDIDPVGACIGEKSSRVNEIVEELAGEKIDIVKYSEDPVEFITEALSPAKVVAVEILSEDPKSCKVSVPESQLSLAIGNKGQNAKLAAKLTGYKIDIKPQFDNNISSEQKDNVSDNAEIKNENQENESVSESVIISEESVKTDET